MIELHTWLAFVAAAAVLLADPGPTILLVVGYPRPTAYRMVGSAATCPASHA